MKKYFLMIPLMLFPYAYLIWMIYMYFSSGVMDKIFGYQTAAYIWLCIAALYLIYIIFIVFYNTIVSARGTYSAYQAAQINLLVKGVQVPAYIFHLVLGMMGSVMSVWGIGIIMVAVVVDLITILLTGISSIGCSIRMKKEKVLNTPVSILMGIGCFIYCADVVIAIVYFTMAKKRREKPEIQAAELG